MKKFNRTTSSIKAKNTMVEKAKDEAVVTKMEIENDNIEEYVDDEEIKQNDEDDDDDDDEEEEDNEDDDEEDEDEDPVNSKSTTGTKQRRKKSVVDTIQAKKHREASVIYIGHLPFLFGEYELLSLLKQFGGTITHVRISRSEKTGNSRGYAFIRILESDIANIIVNTLSGYLLFSQKAIGTHKRFVCHIVPPEKVHSRLFIKHTCAIAVSKARKQQKLLQSTQPKSMSKLSAVNEKLLQLEKKKRMKIKEAGMDYDFPGYEKKDVTSLTAKAAVTAVVTSTPSSSVSNGKRKSVDKETPRNDAVQTKRTMMDDNSVSSKKTVEIEPHTSVNETATTPKMAKKKRLHDNVPTTSSSASKSSLPVSKKNDKPNKKKSRHSH